MTEEQKEFMDAEIRAARKRAAVKEFDDWLASVEQRLCLMREEVGTDLSLRKVLAMKLLHHVTILMQTDETLH